MEENCLCFLDFMMTIITNLTLRKREREKKSCDKRVCL